MKPRLATVWLGGCSGCHMSFLDLDEHLLTLAEQVDIVFSPLMDVKHYPGGVDICLVEGAACNEDHVRMLHDIRSRTRVLVSFGDCAVTGNVPALRNQLGAANTEAVLQCAYIDHAQDRPTLPHMDGIVPRLLDRVVPVHELVPVEYFLPGCPPPAARIRLMLDHLLGAGPRPSGPDLKFG